MNDVKDGQSYSFWKLLNQKEIEIPIIQRDYAQGRIDEKEIRSEFLDALCNAIIKNKNINLDFIYGSSINKYKATDGQRSVQIF